MKFVSVPPSHRLLMKNAPQRSASFTIVSCACFFVPTSSTFLPWDTVSEMNSQASSSIRRVFCRSMMWMPLRCVKMYCRIRGFHRLFWCPKWTPASRRDFIVSGGGS